MSVKRVIGYTDCYIPGNTLSVEEYVKMLSDSFLRDIAVDRNDLTGILKNSIGIKHIYIDDRDNEAEIFGRMLEKYFAEGHASPGEIDFIIYTRGDSLAKGDPWSMTEDACINVPYEVQKKFKMNRAQVFNVEQVCAGTLVGARIAYSFIGDGSARKVVLLSGNFFKKPESRLMGGLGLVSDGLGIMEISSGDRGLELVDFAAATDASMTMVKDFKKGTNPATIVNYGSTLIKSLVKRNNLTLKDISLIIPQNISNSGWNFYCQVLEYPKERIFLDTFNDGGHMGDVDIIRNITEAGKRKLLAPQDYAILYGIGTGTSWNALLLRAVEG